MSASTSSPVSRGSTPPQAPPGPRRPSPPARRDRKSTRLNSSHSQISYAVFCLKKKKKKLLFLVYGFLEALAGGESRQRLPSDLNLVADSSAVSGDVVCVCVHESPLYYDGCPSA